MDKHEKLAAFLVTTRAFIGNPVEVVVRELRRVCPTEAQLLLVYRERLTLAQQFLRAGYCRADCNTDDPAGIL